MSETILPPSRITNGTQFRTEVVNAIREAAEEKRRPFKGERPDSRKVAVSRLLDQTAELVSSLDPVWDQQLKALQVAKVPARPGEGFVLGSTGRKVLASVGGQHFLDVHHPRDILAELVAAQVEDAVHGQQHVAARNAKQQLKQDTQAFRTKVEGAAIRAQEKEEKATQAAGQLAAQVAEKDKTIAWQTAELESARDALRAVQQHREKAEPKPKPRQERDAQGRFEPKASPAQ